MKVRPLHDRVLARRLEETEQVRGGIIIPDTTSVETAASEVEVIAVGPGRLTEAGERAPLEINAGDHILIGKYSGSDIKIDDQHYVIVRENEILATVGADPLPGRPPKRDRPPRRKPVPPPPNRRRDEE